MYKRQLMAILDSFFGFEMFANNQPEMLFLVFVLPMASKWKKRLLLFEFKQFAFDEGVWLQKLFARVAYFQLFDCNQRTRLVQKYHWLENLKKRVKFIF